MINRQNQIDVEVEILKALKKYSDGLSITDLSNELVSGRSTVRTSLAKLEGARKVRSIQIGMAKLYKLF